MSRSSRVRKKSSKLNDFESLDEIEPIYKKKKNSPVKISQKIIPPKIDESDSDETDSDDSDSDLDLKDGFDEDWGENVDPGDMLDDDYDNDGNLQVDEDNASGSKDDANYSQATSLYLSEKKKGTLKDQKNIKKKKVERKDKGKARFTAYMLYARATRPKIAEDNPLMDFSTINKRLGEMWSHVPYTQKQNWRRKANKLEAREEKFKSGNTMITTGKREKTPTTPVKPKATPKGKVQTVYNNKGGNKGQNKPLPLSQNTSLNTQKPVYQTPKKSSSSHALPDASPPAAFKVTGTSPIDVAAHLKLLGESLNNIGQKLKEHEGQIAVSGSLSVLLDSMLCVLGPLACLTNQLDETRGSIPDQTLASILDNIAYIMPGIV